ncbi:hypothetical protein EXN66_Car010168 [Channa argus]|uniref:Uncharacterized protein n=1 Tax=Channa argus TaxID=215402 RepID=A0A6G1PW59_CHAAH|nr:hypothetical protein EXN66_Car010168 [Channa argus]
MRRSRNAEMIPSSFNIIITIYLSLSYGFKVIQPQNRTVDPDGLVSISCEHNANVTSLIDVRLNRISLRDNKRTLLCQKAMHGCENVLIHSNNPQKWLFILLNVGQEAMNTLYECEFTLVENDLHETETGEPTRLLQGQQEPDQDCAPASQLPLAWQCGQQIWILIGVMALMFLCICVMACLYVKLRHTTGSEQLCESGLPQTAPPPQHRSNEEPENCIYVEMKKATQPRNLALESSIFG